MGRRRKRFWEVVLDADAQAQQEVLDAVLRAETPEQLRERRRDVRELRLARLKAAHARHQRRKLDAERDRRASTGSYFLA